MDVNDVSRRVSEGLEVELLVSPRSSRSGIEGIDPWRKRLIIRVKAPPLDGRANREVEEVLEECTGFKSRVTAGQTSRQKTVTVYGDADTACQKIQALL